MRRIVNSLRFIIVAITLFVSAVSAYAQKPGVRGVDENMLRYRYIEKDERKINFSKSLNFSERSYIFVGTGVEGLYQLGYHPESPGYAIGSRLGIGYWATPLHGVEMSLSYGMMPFGYWSENFFGNPVIDNTIIRNMGFEANYVLNVTNHVNRHDKVNTLDFIYAAGVNVGAGDMFNYGVKKLIGAYAAAMGGVDAIIFTAGVGENSASQRLAIASDLEFMGVKMDAEANNVRGKETVISAADSKVKVLLIPTNEELMIAMDTAALV